MANCPLSLCTGTHYLADTPDLGPCPGCCTPAAMQKLDRTITALVEPKPFTEQLDELEGMASQIRDAYRALEQERDAAEEQLATAMARLADYLVSVGHPANPCALPPGPLRELCAALDVIAG